MLARQFEEAGVAALTIHGRYGEQRHKGRVDLDGIAEVVAKVERIPVIGNGDIRVPADALRMVEATGCQGVMIGRGALADPWILRDTHALFTSGQVPPPPSRRERTLAVVEHFEHMLRLLGERTAVVRFRKWMAWYRKTIGPCPKLRRQMPTIQTPSDFYTLMSEFLGELDHEPKGTT